MGLIWLVMAACRPAPPTGVAIDIDGKPPSGWWWFSDTERGFEVQLPGIPKRGSAKESVVIDGQPQVIGMHRTEHTARSSYVILTSPLPGGAVSTSRAASVTEDLLRTRAAALGTLSDVNSWGSPGIAAGMHGQIDTGRIGGAAIRVGLAGETLWVVQGVVDRQGVLERFLESFKKVTPAQMSHPLADSEVLCPARCAAFDDTVKFNNGKTALTGVHGMVDDASFETVALSVAEADRASAIATLRQRAEEDARGTVTTEEGTDTDVRLQLRSGRATIWTRIRQVGDTIFSSSVRATYGVDPSWRESFLASTGAAPASPPEGSGE